ncbi:MAG TPA: DMT family transporter, partial [Gemmatimonadales bacterium]|nr:DMT family transporter [Gemmatimonadales bacterium]
AVLAILAARQRHPGEKPLSAGRAWGSAAFLFLYAVPFSFAFVNLSTGTGALLLFGGVQVTMMMGAVWRGERPGLLQWVGLSIAFGGLVYLVSPGISAPAPLAAVLMLLAGFAWGTYSLRGRGVANPLAATAGNFIRTMPMAAALAVVVFPFLRIHLAGAIWAVISGAVTSGLGYAIWYTALRGLSRSAASIVQLSVPLLAALGGVLFLSEAVTLRLVIAGCLVLGGIALALTVRTTRAAISANA